MYKNYELKKNLTKHFSIHRNKIRRDIQRRVYY